MPNFRALKIARKLNTPKSGCTLFEELRGWDMRAPTSNPQIVLNTPKYRYLNHPIISVFSYAKNSGIENFNPKKSFERPRLLKSRVCLQGHRCCTR